MRTVRFIADRGDAGKMIKDILRGFGFSGTLIKRLKQSESGILKNGEPARTVDRIEPGDVITVNIPPCGAPPESSGAGAVITGRAPVLEMRDYAREVIRYTRGNGRLRCAPVSQSTTYTVTLTNVTFQRIHLIRYGY